MHILMLASENDAIEGAKVGGLADVVRYAPIALARQGCQVTVVIPSYNFLHNVPGARRFHEFGIYFRGYPYYIEAYEVPGRHSHPDVTQVVLQHPDFRAAGPNQMYFNDPGDRPFATDANRFALFCQAAAELILTRYIDSIDCIHLHDWPASLLMILRQYNYWYHPLQKIRTVFTIHNLAMQGVRPLRGDYSSLEAWYPGVPYDWWAVSDRRWPDLVNPMATAIRMADAVHVVSPGYAEEILKPDNKPVFYGGEGLEPDLAYAAGQGRLFGILNGCDYPGDRAVPRVELNEMLSGFRSSVISWSGGEHSAPARHFLAFARIMDRMERKESPGLLLTSVTRVVEQKLLLLLSHGSNGRSGLENLLDLLDEKDLYVLLGFGDYGYERFFVSMSAAYSNFIFLNGYSAEIAKLLYANGDLFIMPSSFEPCGISQMLAMRDGQPCLVNRVGGLKDTVTDGETGFTFAGNTLAEQVDNMTEAATKAIKMARRQPGRWDRIRRQAAAARFSWDDEVKRYIDLLYRPAGSG